MAQYNAKVVKNEKIAPTVWKMTVHVHSEQNFKFKPGQFVVIEKPMPKAETITVQAAKAPKGYFSIACAPDPEGNLEFLVEHRDDGGEMSKWMVERQPKDKLKLEGPMGKLELGQADKWPQAFLGYRAGVAPLRSLIQAALRMKGEQPVWLFLGASGADDLLLDEEWKELAQQNDRFRYVPCANPARQLLEEISERKGIDLYLAGFKKELEPMRDVLLEAGFPKTELRSESFG